MMKFAAERAGADLDGKDDMFRDMVGFYDDIDQYNTRGRVDDPERPYYQDNSEYHWAWINPADRATYRSLKNRSREASRRRDFLIGLAVVNRIVSMPYAMPVDHSARSTVHFHRRREFSTAWT